MAADPRDIFLQQHTPVVMVPRFGEFEPMTHAGHRFLAAADGLWIEAVRQWLYVRAPIAASEVAMPFGQVSAREEYTFHAADIQRVLQRFMADARAALPNECAAWGVWDESASRLRYTPLKAIDATPGSVKFHRPGLGDGLHLAVDLHSHGATSAFFSGTDDADDAGEVKLSIVIGDLGQDEPSIAMRLCVLGLFIDGIAGLE